MGNTALFDIISKHTPITKSVKMAQLLGLIEKETDGPSSYFQGILSKLPTEEVKISMI